MPPTEPQPAPDAVSSLQVSKWQPEKGVTATLVEMKWVNVDLTLVKSTLNGQDDTISTDSMNHSKSEINQKRCDEALRGFTGIWHVLICNYTMIWL